MDASASKMKSLQELTSHPVSLHDGNGQVRREIAFFGPSELKMFGCIHIPVQEAIGSVVVCSPLHAEFAKNYRREVLLADTLANSGLSVCRFHYLGTGHSDDRDDSTFVDMRDDTLTAVDWVMSRVGLDNIAFVGTRMAGLIAAAAAARFKDAPLVLWEPVVEPSRYFREVFRARLISDLKDGATTPRSPDLLMKEMSSRGFVDILGYQIERSFYESSLGRTLSGELGEHTREVLLVELTTTSKLRGEYVALNTLWQDMGLQVHTDMVKDQSAWWFEGGRRDEEEMQTRFQNEEQGTKELIEMTAKWIVPRVSGG